MSFKDAIQDLGERRQSVRTGDRNLPFKGGKLDLRGPFSRELFHDIQNTPLDQIRPIDLFVSPETLRRKQDEKAEFALRKAQEIAIKSIDKHLSKAQRKAMGDYRSAMAKWSQKKRGAQDAPEFPSVLEEPEKNGQVFVRQKKTGKGKQPEKFKKMLGYVYSGYLMWFTSNRNPNYEPWRDEAQAALAAATQWYASLDNTLNVDGLGVGKNKKDLQAGLPGSKRELFEKVRELLSSPPNGRGKDVGAERVAKLTWSTLEARVEKETLKKGLSNDPNQRLSQLNSIIGGVEYKELIRLYREAIVKGHLEFTQGLPIEDEEEEAPPEVMDIVGAEREGEGPDIEAEEEVGLGGRATGGATDVSGKQSSSPKTGEQFGSDAEELDPDEVVIRIYTERLHGVQGAVAASYAQLSEALVMGGYKKAQDKAVQSIQDLLLPVLLGDEEDKAVAGLGSTDLDVMDIVEEFPRHLFLDEHTTDEVYTAVIRIQTKHEDMGAFEALNGKGDWDGVTSPEWVANQLADVIRYLVEQQSGGEAGLHNRAGSNVRASVVVEGEKPSPLHLLGEAFLSDAADMRLVLEARPPARAFGGDVVTEPQAVPPEVEDPGLAAQLHKWYELRQADDALRRKAESLRVKIDDQEFTTTQVRDAIAQVYKGMEPALQEMGDTVTRVDNIIFELSQRTRRSAKWRSMLKATSAEVHRLAQQGIGDMEEVDPDELTPQEAVQLAMQDLLEGMEVFLDPVADLLNQADMLMAEERVKTHRFVDIDAEPMGKFQKESIEFLRETFTPLDIGALGAGFAGGLYLGPKLIRGISRILKGVGNKIRQMFVGKDRVKEAADDLEAAARKIR